MKIKGFVKPIQNAQAIWVEPVGPLAGLPVKKSDIFPISTGATGSIPPSAGLTYNCDPPF
jgi:hypothetical protein